MSEYRRNLGEILAPPWARNELPRTEGEQAERFDFVFEQVGRTVFDVLTTVAGGPAERAGLRQGDIITAIDEKPIETIDFSRIIQEKNGQPCKLQIMRENAAQDIELIPIWHKNAHRWVAGLTFGARKERTDMSEVFHHEGENGETRVLFSIPEAEGRMARMQVVLGERSTDRPTAREVKSVALVTPKGPYDLLQRFGTPGVHVSWEPSLGTAGACMDSQVTIDNLFTESTPHVIIHELHHVRQGDDPKLKKLKSSYLSTLSKRYNKPTSYAIDTPKSVSAIAKILHIVYQPEPIPKEAEDFIQQTEEHFAAIAEKQERLATDKDLPERYMRRAYRNVMRELVDPTALKAISNLFRERTTAIDEMRRGLMEARAFINDRLIDETTNDTDIRIAWSTVKTMIQAENAPDTSTSSFDWWNAKIDAATGKLHVKQSPSSRYEISLPTIPGGASMFEDTRRRAGEHATERRDAAVQELALLRKEIGDLEDKNPRHDTKVFSDLTVQDILRLPTYLIERDAEYAAIVGLRQVKKETGIDLLSPVTSLIADNNGAISIKPSVVALMRATVKSLRSAHDYTVAIGVPHNCIQKIRRKNRKKTKE